VRVLWQGRAACECGWFTNLIVWEDGAEMICPSCQEPL
jgi:hypothetical protein